MTAQKQITLAAVEAWVREAFRDRTSRAHGWPHIDRVRSSIRVLARAEGVDPILAELAALLHDVGRTQPGPASEHGARSAAMAEPLLAGLPLTDEERQAVLYAIRWHNSQRDDTQLLCVLRDADMLDGMGAIGIMRAFRSQTDLPTYDPNDPFGENHHRWPPLFASDQFLGQMAWYGYLNTDTARKMAKGRFDFMQAFVAQARRELEARDE